MDQAPESAPLIRGHCASTWARSLLVLKGQQGDGFGRVAIVLLTICSKQTPVGLAAQPRHRVAQGDMKPSSYCKALGQLPPQAVVGTAVQDATGRSNPVPAGLIRPELRCRKVGRADSLRPEPLRLDWLSGCSLLLQPTAHRPPACFDPSFPLYYEDMDLCLRLAQQGLRCCGPQPAVQHQRGDGSVTPSSRRLELSTTSYVRFLRRHCSPWVTQLRQPRLLLSALLRPRRSGAIWRGFRRAG